MRRCGGVLPLRLRWSLAIGAPVIADAGLDATALGGWTADHVARARGADELYAAAVEALREAYDITSRGGLMAWARERLKARRELAHVVAAFSVATVAHYVSDDDAWQAILLAARLAQLGYASWDDFAASCDAVSDEVRAQWATLPWATELGVEVAPRERVRRSICPVCGARRARPATHAFVYCDVCGQLADYDLERACVQPLAQPGPAYEAVAAELAGPLAAAQGDLVRTRAIQRALFEAWVDACPDAVPIRCREPAYHAAYVAMIAEGETRAAFDPAARALRVAMTDAVAKLGFTADGDRTRVLVASYRVMEAAMFAHEARRHELALAHGIYDMHPDHASPALIRRIGFAMYVQGWLPHLDAADAEALLARTGLASVHDEVEPPELRALRCPICDQILEIVATASRVVCAHCGRPVDVPRR